MSERVTVMVELVREAADGLLVREPASGAEVWLPKKFVAVEESPLAKRRITMPLWLARSRGLAPEAAPAGQGRLL